MNLARDIERRARQAPEKAGLIFENGTEFTYAQMDTKSSKTARLLQEYGVNKGDRVAIYMQNRPQLVFSLVACWKIGAVPTPINVMYKSEELEKVFSKTSPRVLIADDMNLGIVEEKASRFNATIVVSDSEPNVQNAIWYSDRLKEVSGDHFPAIELDDDAEAAILSTGGTSGDPKAVSINHKQTHKSLSKLAQAMKGGDEPPYEVASPDTPPNIVTLPLFHSGGQQSMLFAYHVGRSVILMRRFGVEKLSELVGGYSVDNLVLMPTMIFDLVDYDGKVPLDSVEAVLSTGQKLDLNLRKRFEEKYDIPILENYGSTEVGHVAGWTMNEIREGEWKPGSAGKIYDGVDVEIRDEDGKPVPQGETGEICVREGISGEGYVGSEDELRRDDDWVYTGDMGYIDEDGVLFIEGRKREMIKTGGFQVWPSELEEVLRKHDMVKEITVLGVQDERMGEIPKAFVVPTEESIHPESAQETLIEYCRDKLSHYKTIRAVEFVDKMPRTDAGKINRGELEQFS